MIDPYQLLGLTIESTPEEARASFRDLALLAHPDKGGIAAEFKILLDAYRYVTAQLGAVNRTETVESLEATFAAFCEAQKADEDLRPAWVRDLLRGVGDGAEFDAYRFNEAFDRAAMPQDDGQAAAQDAGAEAEAEAGVSKVTDIHASSKGGYGEMMEPSEYAGMGMEAVSSVQYRPIDVTYSIPFVANRRHDVAPPNSRSSASAHAHAHAHAHASASRPFERNVVVYVQPQPGVSQGGRAGLCSSDYVDAFNTTPEPLADDPPTLGMPVDDLFERMMQLRTQDALVDIHPSPLDAQPGRASRFFRAEDGCKA
jgi:hypothetical protein